MTGNLLRDGGGDGGDGGGGGGGDCYDTHTHAHTHVSIIFMGMCVCMYVCLCMCVHAPRQCGRFQPKQRTSEKEHISSQSRARSDCDRNVIKYQSTCPRVAKIA